MYKLLNQPILLASVNLIIHLLSFVLSIMGALLITIFNPSMIIFLLALLILYISILTVTIIIQNEFNNNIISILKFYHSKGLWKNYHDFL